MIRKLLFLFIMLSHGSLQAMSLNCAVECSLTKAMKAVASDQVSHQCCNKKHKDKQDKKNNEKKKHHSCKDSVNGTCFHKLAGSTIMPMVEKIDFDKNSISSDLIAVQFYKIETINNRFSPKILVYLDYEEYQDKFLAYKARQDLYIIKDQFLI